MDDLMNGVAKEMISGMFKNAMAGGAAGGAPPAQPPPMPGQVMYPQSSPLPMQPMGMGPQITRNPAVTRV